MPTASPPPSGTPSASPPSDANDAATAAAIVKAYRGQFDEFNRLDMAGGADKPSEKLLATTSGSHRNSVMTALMEDKQDGIRALAPGRLVGVVVGSGSASSRRVTACEDYTKVKWIKKNGAPVHVDQPILNLQHSIAKKGTDGMWRIDHNHTDHVSSLKSSICNGGDQ